jgi:hypothetical protein
VTPGQSLAVKYGSTSLRRAVTLGTSRVWYAHLYFRLMYELMRLQVVFIWLCDTTHQILITSARTSLATSLSSTTLTRSSVRLRRHELHVADSAHIYPSVSSFAFRMKTPN